MKVEEIPLPKQGTIEYKHSDRCCMKVKSFGTGYFSGRQGLQMKIKKTTAALKRPFDLPVMWLRKAKAKLTGRYPCTFATKHGHDFDVVKVQRMSGIPVVFYRCSECGLRATYDPYTGLCA